MTPAELISNPIVLAFTWILAPVLVLGIILAAIRELRGRQRRRKDDPVTIRNLRNAELFDSFREADGTHRINPLRILTKA